MYEGFLLGISKMYFVRRGKREQGSFASLIEGAGIVRFAD